MTSAYDQGARAALAVYSKTALAAPIPFVQRAATGTIQGLSSLALNAALAQPGDRGRQAAIGGASDALGGFIGGWKGMGASMLGNMALQHVTAPTPQPPPDPYKTADHADDRLRERIRAEFSPGLLDQLREQASDLDVEPGRYYLHLKDSKGHTAAVAAFKTVGKDNKLVLATILNPKKNPPSGSSLVHRMTQPEQKKAASLI